MSTRRAPRGRAVGLSRFAPGPSLAAGPASGSAADTSRRVSPKSSDNSPPFVPTQAPAPPSSIVLVLAPLLASPRPSPVAHDTKSEVAGREVLSAVRGAKGPRRPRRPRQPGGGGQDRILLLTTRLGYRAAGAEPAPGRDAQRARRVTRYGRTAAVRGALGHPGDRGEQALGVGVPRRAEDLLGGRDLDDPAQVHDRD